MYRKPSSNADLLTYAITNANIYVSKAENMNIQNLPPNLQHCTRQHTCASVRENSAFESIQGE
jgi:hypothetical protein